MFLCCICCCCKIYCRGKKSKFLRKCFFIFPVLHFPFRRNQPFRRKKSRNCLFVIFSKICLNDNCGYDLFTNNLPWKWISTWLDFNHRSRSLFAFLYHRHNISNRLSINFPLLPWRKGSLINVPLKKDSCSCTRIRRMLTKIQL